ncbi:hypothetical protein KKH26_03505 [Patescibacteria group bacterium]|nr:hypothetical protein [Patescibacteria group bacterium]MBU4343100.1 hypothetical protein [Candidatus Omnitrophota bacterium]
MNTTELNIEKIQESILRIEQLKSDFLSTINHELRTPLTVSREGVEILLDRITGNINNEQEKLLNVTKKNLERLTRAIENLPDFLLGRRDTLT